MHPSFTKQVTQSSPRSSSMNYTCTHENQNPFISANQELLKSPSTKQNYIATELLKNLASFSSYI